MRKTSILMTTLAAAILFASGMAFTQTMPRVELSEGAAVPDELVVVLEEDALEDASDCAA